MNEKFFALPEEKRHQIINAAIEVFSKYDYKHASTDLIAAKAGISKGSLFYYFHNKKELYLYLYNYIMDVMKEQLPDRDILILLISLNFWNMRPVKSKGNGARQPLYHGFCHAGILLGERRCFG